MGRTLVKAISDIKGFALAGVLEDTRSPLIGWDAGTLAGTPENGVKLTGDAAALIDKADSIVDFTALTNCPPKRFTPSRRRRGRRAGAVALAPRGSKTGRCLSGRLCRAGGVEEQSDGGIGSFILPIRQTLSTIIYFFLSAKKRRTKGA